MLVQRRLHVPTMPDSEGLSAVYADRLEALARCPVVPSRLPWRGLANVVLGMTLGLAISLALAPSPQNVSPLTPQQQQIYGLVQDLAQTTTPHEAWIIMGRLDKVVRLLHPQPRPAREALLPSAAP